MVPVVPTAAIVRLILLRIEHLWFMFVHRALYLLTRIIRVMLQKDILLRKVEGIGNILGDRTARLLDEMVLFRLQ